MVGITYVYADKAFGFNGYFFFFFKPIFTAKVDVWAWLFGHMRFSMSSYMHVFCISTCSVQLSMFHMERRSRNALIIIIITA